MSGCLLRVNNLQVTSIVLRPKGDKFDIVIEDDEFGEFALSRGCYLEFLDLGMPKKDRESDPFHGWKHVTFDELVEIVRGMKVSKPSPQ